MRPRLYDDIGNRLDDDPHRPLKFGEAYYCPDDDSFYWRDNDGYIKQIVSPGEFDHLKAALPIYRLPPALSIGDET